ncbi:MAG: D-alanine--D-alanine ligase, partial [Melioribacteraceae bacterium]
MKVAIVFNEVNPEIYETVKRSSKGLDFKPVFDMQSLNPITEFEYMAKSLQKAGYEAYTFNIMDSIQNFIKD